MINLNIVEIVELKVFSAYFSQRKNANPIMEKNTHRPVANFALVFPVG